MTGSSEAKSVYRTATKDGLAGARMLFAKPRPPSACWPPLAQARHHRRQRGSSSSLPMAAAIFEVDFRRLGLGRASLGGLLSLRGALSAS